MTPVISFFNPLFREAALRLSPFSVTIQTNRSWTSSQTMVKQRPEQPTAPRFLFLAFLQLVLVQFSACRMDHCCPILAPSRWRKMEVRASVLPCRKAEAQSIGRLAQTLLNSSFWMGSQPHLLVLESAPSLFHQEFRPKYWTMARHFSQLI